MVPSQGLSVCFSPLNIFRRVNHHHRRGIILGENRVDYDYDTDDDDHVHDHDHDDADDQPTLRNLIQSNDWDEVRNVLKSRQGREELRRDGNQILRQFNKKVKRSADRRRKRIHLSDLSDKIRKVLKSRQIREELRWDGNQILRQFNKKRMSSSVSTPNLLAVSFHSRDWSVERRRKRRNVSNESSSSSTPPTSTLLYEACSCCCSSSPPPLDVLEMMINIFPESVLIPDEGSGYNTPLHAACRHYVGSPCAQRDKLHTANVNTNLLDIVQLLLHKSTPRNSVAAIRNAYGQTPLHVACFFKCHIDVIVSLCYAFPPALEARTLDGDTPLTYAVRRRASEKVLSALKKGVDWYRKPTRPIMVGWWNMPTMGSESLNTKEYSTTTSSVNSDGSVEAMEQEYVSKRVYAGSFNNEPENGDEEEGILLIPMITTEENSSSPQSSSCDSVEFNMSEDSMEEILSYDLQCDGLSGPSTIGSKKTFWLTNLLAMVMIIPLVAYIVRQAAMLMTDDSWTVTIAVTAGFITFLAIRSQQTDETEYFFHHEENCI